MSTALLVAAGRASAIRGSRGLSGPRRLVALPATPLLLVAPVCAEVFRRKVPSGASYPPALYFVETTQQHLRDQTELAPHT